MSTKHRGVEAALDLRVFLDRVKNAGELQAIEGATWDLEIGALAEIYAGRGHSPALLFDHISGYPSGYRVLSNILFSPLRKSLALGMDQEMTETELIKWVKDKLADLKPLAPEEVSKGPILDHVSSGRDVNLFQFPVPRWHELDGGRYIGTFDAVILRDPDTGYVNIGTYRGQVHDERTVGLYMIPGKHGDLITRKYWEKGENCPFLIVCGIPPGLMAASSVGIPWSMSEYDFLGGMLGTPIPVVKSEVTGLPIPAYAEIALEGYAPPPDKESRWEGPFGEWPGYYASGSRKGPVVDIETVYHRHDPIITGDPPLKTYLNDDLYLLMRAANIWSAMERAGIPDIQGVCFPHQGRFMVVVSIRQRYSGHAKQAGYAVLATRDGGRDTTMVIIVDEDIDITNMNEVLWAVSSRWDPKSASETVEVPASVLNPRLSPGKKDANELVGSCIIIDACKPYSWINKFPPASSISDDYRQQMIEKWGNLLGVK